MRFKALIFSFVILSNIVYAQENIYQAATIPKELLPYASAVVRNAQEAVEVKDLDNVVYYVKRTITVFNKNGDRAAEIVLSSDKLSSIKYAKGAVYNETGNLLFKFSDG